MLSHLLKISLAVQKINTCSSKTTHCIIEWIGNFKLYLCAFMIFVNTLVRMIKYYCNLKKKMLTNPCTFKTWSDDLKGFFFKTNFKKCAKSHFLLTSSSPLSLLHKPLPLPPSFKNSPLVSLFYQTPLLQLKYCCWLSG